MSKGFKDYLAEANAAIETCSVQDALRLQGREDWVFVDVRDGAELASEGRIPGAVHASRGLLEFRIDPDSPMHDPAFDLAFCMAHLFLKCVWRPDLTYRYLACFDAFTEANLEGVSWEPAADLEGRTCIMLAGMLLARIDGKSPVEYITEETDKNRVRGLARAWLLDPAAALAAMREAWQVEWQR